MNAFELKGSPGAVVVFATGIDRDAASTVTKDTFAEQARLRAVILADESYLDHIWGDEKLYDSAAKSIEWAN